MRPEIGEALADVIELQALTIRKLTERLEIYESADETLMHVPEIAEAEAYMGKLGL
jgi:hypothetical protein